MTIEVFNIPKTNSSESHNIRRLIPDLLPLDHVSLNMKRVRFIRGQGVVLYDDVLAVEIYTPKGNESPVFFGVHRHHGNIQELKNYFLKPKVMHIQDQHVTESMKSQYEEAVFQFMPIAVNTAGHIVQASTKKKGGAKEIFMGRNFSGAA